MGFQPKRLPDGRLLVPMRAEGPNGEIGHGVIPIGPDHPDYQRWLAELERIERMDQPGVSPAK